MGTRKKTGNLRFVESEQPRGAGELSEVKWWRGFAAPHLLTGFPGPRWPPGLKARQASSLVLAPLYCYPRLQANSFWWCAYVLLVDSGARSKVGHIVASAKRRP